MNQKCCISWRLRQGHRAPFFLILAGLALQAPKSSDPLDSYLQATTLEHCKCLMPLAGQTLTACIGVRLFGFKAIVYFKARACNERLYTTRTLSSTIPADPPEPDRSREASKGVRENFQTHPGTARVRQKVWQMARKTFGGTTEP